VTICDNLSDLGLITCGAPQGSVLGPWLFLIYVNDICYASPDSNAKLFADDANVFVCNNSVNVHVVISQYYLTR